MNLNLNYDDPIKIAEDIYWVGFYDQQPDCIAIPI